MRNTTLKNSRVIELLNKNHYFVDFDAEHERTISFRNHTFKYQPTGDNTGVHQLATALGTVNGNLSYPTLCFLSSNYEIVFQYGQYLNPTDFLKILEQSN
jgi:thioredoxin-related protein